jgi:hypothetical protein
MTVVPIHQMRRQLPEQGRIRIGKKGPRGAPVRLQTFRFTSHDELAIREIASRYGGLPVPWSDGPRQGEWEVITTTARVPILLPPEPLGSGEQATPIYELWSGGGCLRRCDGEFATVPDGEGQTVTDCICNVKGTMECKPKTRLVVILREIRFGGGWRVETGGWTAARELPGMVDALLGLQSRGIIAGELVLREERKVARGKTTKWMVPMLTTDSSADELATGQGTVGALSAPPSADSPDPAALAAGETFFTVDRVEGDVIDLLPAQPELLEDAELVDEELAPMHPTRAVTATAAEITFFQACADLASLPECDGRSVDDVRHALVQLVTHGRATSSKLLTANERTTGIQLITDVLAGDRRVLGFGDRGIRLSGRRKEGSA